MSQRAGVVLWSNKVMTVRAHTEGLAWSAPEATKEPSQRTANFPLIGTARKDQRRGWISL